MNLRYLPPAADDAVELGRLHVLCWRQAYEGLVNAEYLASLSAADRAEQWHRTIAAPDVFKLLACDANGPIGFVVSGPAREAVSSIADGEIYALYLLSRFQGQGVGHQLFSEALADWRDRRGRALAVQVISSNRKGVDFYRRHGGKEVARGSFELGGQALEEITFVYPLS